MVAVKQNGYAIVLNYAIEELRNDPDIVEAAVKHNGDAVRYAMFNIEISR